MSSCAGSGLSHIPTEPWQQLGCAGSLRHSSPLWRGFWGPGHCSLSLDALEPAADSAPSLSCAQIWADPGKYALMGAAAQLGEFPMAQSWPPPARVGAKVAWEKVIPAYVAQLLPRLKPSLAVGFLTTLPSTGSAWGTSEGWAHPGHPCVCRQSWIIVRRLRDLRCSAVPSPRVFLPS